MRTSSDNPIRASEAEELVTQLIWLTNRLSVRAIAAFRPLGVSAIGARIVNVLEETPTLRASALSSRIAVDPAATSRALKDLKAQGCVYADVHRRLGLTEKGIRLRDEVDALSHDLYVGLTAGFSHDERRALFAGLARLRKNFAALPTLEFDPEPSAPQTS